MKENLLRFRNRQKYLVFDYETCGLNLGSLSNKPWQLAFLLCEGKTILSRHNYWLHWDDIEVSVDSIFAAELKNETQEAAKSAKPKTSPEPIEQDKKPIPEEASAPEAFTPQPKVESPQ